MLVPRVGRYEAVDAQLRSIRQAMADCPCTPAGLLEMLNLLIRRDQLLEQRLKLERTSS